MIYRRTRSEQVCFRFMCSKKKFETHRTCALGRAILKPQGTYGKKGHTLTVSFEIVLTHLQEWQHLANCHKKNNRISHVSAMSSLYEMLLISLVTRRGSRLLDGNPLRRSDIGPGRQSLKTRPATQSQSWTEASPPQGLSDSLSYSVVSYPCI